MAQQQTWPDEASCRQNMPVDKITQGWCLSIDRAKGNCIACHTFNIAPWPPGLPVAGNIAPPLVAMQPRFPEQALLKKQIENASAVNPNSTMPPYLNHDILTAAEIDLIVEFLLSI